TDVDAERRLREEVEEHVAHKANRGAVPVADVRIALVVANAGLDFQAEVAPAITEVQQAYGADIEIDIADAGTGELRVLAEVDAGARARIPARCRAGALRQCSRRREHRCCQQHSYAEF